jgi:hypothetical protein
MDEEHFPFAAVSAIKKDPGAMNRQSNLAFCVDRSPVHIALALPSASIGERHVPRNKPFNLPTKVAIAQDGEIYVADGYGNAQAS